MNTRVKKISSRQLVKSEVGLVIETAVKIAPKSPSPLYIKAMDMARDPKEAEAFLKRAGIITKAGKLAPEYAA